MAQLSNAQMRAVIQRLVVDTGATAAGLSSADYTELINAAMLAYADMFPDAIVLSGLLKTVTIANNDASKAVDFHTPPPIVRNITGAFLRSQNPMQAKPFLDILRQQVDAPTTGKPTQYALVSASPGVAASGASLIYTMYLWPISDGSYSVDLYGTQQPILVSADGDSMIYQDAECRIIARMAALEAARILGRPQDFIQGIASQIPDMVRAQLGVMARETAPRTSIGTPIA